MPGEATTNPDLKVSVKVVAVSIVTFLLGLAGLILSDSLPVWYPHNGAVALAAEILQHTAEVLASVGVIGLLVEISARRELTEEIERKIRALFHMDREVADALSTETRQQIVKTTLSAHLGDDLGPAIFNGLVRTYLENRNTYRRNARYHITLRDMPVDKILQCGSMTKVFPASEFFEITAEYRFDRRLTASKHKTIVCVFDDEWDELIDQFRDPECLLRESLPLCFPNIKEFFDTLRNNACAIDALCTVSGELDGKPLKIVSSTFRDRCAVVELDVSALPVNEPIEHRIQFDGFIAKSARSFPILIVEPTCDPEFEFSYPPSLHVKVEDFLTGAMPFDVDKVKNPGKKRVKMKGNKPEESWVFPNSGVLFIWDYAQPSPQYGAGPGISQSNIVLVPDRA